MSAQSRRRNVFVVGLDTFHARNLERIPDRDRFRFHGLLRAEEIVYQDDYDIDAKLEEAARILRDFDGPVDAIIGHWDFPVSSMVPILAAEFGLLAPTLEAVLKCAHKYWSRIEQARHAPDVTPGFCAVDPFADDPYEQVTLDFPFWMKPVKGYSSTLGFRIGNRKEFDRAIEITRKRIRRFGDAFNTILARADLPPEVAGVDGNHMIVEELCGGLELAPEGYVQHGGFHAHGVIDMIRGPNHKSFQAYRYPSTRPRRLQERTIDSARRVMEGIGFDNGCFNMEFFWNEASDALRIVEINPRISQSHCDLFEKVDGMSNHEVAIHVALGDEPRFEHGGGSFHIAAKFLYRRYDPSDAVCVRVPSASDLARLRDRQPETVVCIQLEEGMRLSELKDQDPYTWVLAELMIGAEDVRGLNRKYEEAKALLPFEFEPLPDGPSIPPGSRVHD
ncbi:MAG: ATP-grasp domain-containing protein [Myxococcota bacterium]